MIARLVVLTSLTISTNALSIGTVSEQNVTKREANLGEHFPDLVPFKNKHGEELEEFVQVNRKPKKRVALPVNFILRAVAEPESDDYHEKVQGERDSVDYFKEDHDYKDSITDKHKIEPIEGEHSESEAKKEFILDTVDEPKERYAIEQVEIMEKAKEDEIYKEKLEREKIQAQLSYPETDKYDDRSKIKKKYPDYEEYEDKEISLEENYRVNSEKTKPTTIRLPKRTNNKEKKEKKLESGKLPFFVNPRSYILYEDLSDDESDDETSTSKPRKLQTTDEPNNVKKYSAKYTAAPTNKDNQVRISLVPEDNDGKEGEPTLFVWQQNYSYYDGL